MVACLFIYSTDIYWESGCMPDTILRAGDTIIRNTLLPLWCLLSGKGDEQWKEKCETCSMLNNNVDSGKQIKQGRT